MRYIIKNQLRSVFSVLVSVLLVSSSLYSSDAAAQKFPGEAFGMAFSTAPDRGGAIALNGATVNGDVYVFLTPISPLSTILRVKWYLDAPVSPPHFFRDTKVPYDFQGGTPAAAIAFDTTTLADGQHTISARIIYAGSPTQKETVTSTFTVDNSGPAAGPDPFEFGLADAPDRFDAAAELLPDPAGVLELLFGEVFIFIGESSTCTLAGCSPVVDPQTPPPPVLTAVTFTFDIGTGAELVVNTDTLAPFDIGAVGDVGDNPANVGFNLDTLPQGIHTLTATMTTVSGPDISLTRTFLTQPLIVVLPPTLKNEVPLEDDQLVEGNGIIADNGAAIVLGRSLYWDLQTGGDGRQACATCHYHAGVDNRILNTVNPRAGGYHVDSGGPGGTLTSADFNFLQFADPLDRNTAITRNIDDVVGSQGLPQKDFAGINLGSDADSFTDPAMLDLDFVDIDGKQHRRVTGRNTPTNINAAFNVRSFWDGRANFVFNGQNPFGARDPGAVVYVNNGPAGSAPFGVQLRLRFSSLASQASGPPNNNTEMSYDGRSFPELGRKLLDLGITPLAKQMIAFDDSVFGASGPLLCVIAGGCGAPGGMGLSATYVDLIKAAFHPKYWNGGNVNINGVSYTQMEANFSMFFSIAIQKWEFTLVSDDSKWDRFRMGTPGIAGEQQAKLDLAFALMDAAEEPGAVSGNTAPFPVDDILTNAETAGMLSFLGGECVACHGGAALSAATTPFILGAVPAGEPAEQVVERMLMEQGIAALEIGLIPPSAMYDLGFYNIGVRTTGEDLGIGGVGDFGNPLSFARQLQSGLHVDAGLSSPIPGASPEPGLLVVDPNLFVRSAGQSPLGAPVAVNGAFKVPTLRNIELTAPYMHNGGHISLEDVVAFYARGADFGIENIADLDPEVGGIGNLRGNPAGVADLVTFLLTFTDNRVKEEAAPFDHPAILLENGVVVEAVGAGGMGTGSALPTFANRLDGPTARADDYVIALDEVLNDDVLTNDSDGDGSGNVQNPVMIAMQGPFNGILNALNTNGNFTYTPDLGFRGVDGFAYDMETDDPADPRSNVARVTIQVGDEIPVANPDLYMTDFETELLVAAPGVLDNDTDNDKPSLVATQVGPDPANAASFTFSSDGSFSYTPMTGFSGSVEFMYTADDAGPSNVATVTIEVAPPGSPCPADGVSRLCYSLSADRSDPLLLDGATLSGAVHIFIMPLVPVNPPDPSFRHARFWVDIPGTLLHTNRYSKDKVAPYDFNGGNVGTSFPFPTGTAPLTPGVHTIRSNFKFFAGGMPFEVPAATFTVE